MRALLVTALTAGIVGCVSIGCIDVTIPPEAGTTTGSTTGTTGPPVTRPPSSVVDNPDTRSPGLSALDSGGTGGEEPDQTPATPCEINCDCPPGQDCINDKCVEGNKAIYCCEHPECPSGHECWVDTVGGVCP